MTTTPLCFVDVESTGLDPRIHQPWEVCVWRQDAPEPATMLLRHTLDYAMTEALEIGGYWHRRPAMQPGEGERETAARTLTALLHGATLVGSNPSFDAAMLTQFLGYSPWHHRLIDVSQGAMWILGLDRPPGLAKAAGLLRDRGFEIPEADHTAEGDVRATRAVYLALRELQSTIGEHRAAKPATRGGAR